MIRIHDLPEEAAQAAITDGEFPPSITGGTHVAVIMTQSWCTDWMMMRSWLRNLTKAGKPAERDIDVFVLVYNKAKCFEEFRVHKEDTFGNHLIPYVRYYGNGVYLGDSNQLRERSFLARFDT
jgi:hypothetical protein